LYIKFKHHNNNLFNYYNLFRDSGKECSEEIVEVGTRIENSFKIIVNDVEIVSNNIVCLIPININVKKKINKLSKFII